VIILNSFGIDIHLSKVDFYVLIFFLASFTFSLV